MGKSLYGIPFSNSLIVDDAKEEQQIEVRNVENDESLEVVDAGTNQEINVYGGSVTPELPKVLDNEQINVYAPVAGENFPGLAFFNKSHFSIAVNGLVSLLKGGIERIEKIKTENGIDTWGIFLTDGRIEYFTIENGKAGTPGSTPQLKVKENDELYVSYDSGNTWYYLCKLPMGPAGPIGPKGDSFEIKKVYTSIEEMNENFDTDGVPIGGLVLISTGSVEDEDNSKLFVKHEDGYRYLTDLSGSQGMQGPPGYTPVKGIDYYTSAEKNAIIDEIIDKIPFAEGVSV